MVSRLAFFWHWLGVTVSILLALPRRHISLSGDMFICTLFTMVSKWMLVVLIHPHCDGLQSVGLIWGVMMELIPTIDGTWCCLEVVVVAMMVLSLCLGYTD